MSSILCQYALYPTVLRSTIGPEVSDFFAFFMPTQAIWTIAIGFLTDYTRTPWIMCVMCSCLMGIYAISYSSAKLWAHLLACVVFTITQGAIFEVKFTFVSEMFDPYNYGKLVGFLGVLGGLGTFTNIPISSSQNTGTVFLVYVCSMPILTGLAYFLGRRQQRGVTYKTLPDTLPVALSFIGSAHLEE